MKRAARRHFRPVYVATRDGYVLADLRDPAVVHALAVGALKRRQYAKKQHAETRRGP